MKAITSIVLGLGLMLSACDEDAPPEAQAPAAMPVPSPPPAPGAAPELTDDDVAVAEDFIEEATTEVTATNYKATLDGLEQEIAAAVE